MPLRRSQPQRNDARGGEDTTSSPLTCQSLTPVRWRLAGGSSASCPASRVEPHSSPAVRTSSCAAPASGRRSTRAGYKAWPPAPQASCRRAQHRGSRPGKSTGLACSRSETAYASASSESAGEAGGGACRRADLAGRALVQTRAARPRDKPGEGRAEDTIPAMARAASRGQASSPSQERTPSASAATTSWPRLCGRSKDKSSDARHTCDVLWHGGNAGSSQGSPREPPPLRPHARRPALPLGSPCGARSTSAARHAAAARPAWLR